MGTQETILGVIADRLLDIDATLKELLALSKSKRAGLPTGKESLPATQPTVATDADLDSQYGDPVVKFDPRDWTGDNYRGQKFSVCPPDFLDALAKAFDYFVSKNDAHGDAESAKKAHYDRLNAARARGWAARKRAGWTPPAVDPQWQGGEPEQW